MANLSAPQLEWQVERADREPGRADLELAGNLSLHAAFAAIARMRQLVDESVRHVHIDLSGLRSLDAASAALLIELRDELRHEGFEAEVGGGSERVEAILELVASSPRGVTARDKASQPGVVEQVGFNTARISRFGLEILDFVGRTVVAAGGAIREPRRIPWREVLSLMERAGADALPIIALITFLVGLVSAFQGAITLHRYGADIFVADGIAIGMTREFGPLMVAIVAAGRSGAAFAAELGTMRVSEEVDALRTIGLDPFPYLVLPRVIALAAMVPILTLLGDAVAIMGGATVGVFGLDLTFTAYLTETRLRLTFWNIFTGLIKSLAFAIAIGLIGCKWGLATRGGAEGVGRATTSAVVTMLFSLVIVDAAWTLVFYAWDI
ncbi:MAG TPA: MlaE family lipid ABC transporter permease subunit [Myxococcota bacterium]|nr:MlaE family lipid ABC transporter permease subunit [Myxococcota bacterium]